jgi:hypothetical protein
MSGFGYRPSTFVYPEQTPEQRKNDVDPRVQVSEMLLGPKRSEDETFEDYKIRMKVEYQLTRDYLKGYFIAVDEPSEPSEPLVTKNKEGGRI